MPFSRYKILHYKEEQGAFTKTIKELLEIESVKVLTKGKITFSAQVNPSTGEAKT